MLNFATGDLFVDPRYTMLIFTPGDTFCWPTLHYVEF